MVIMTKDELKNYTENNREIKIIEEDIKKLQEQKSSINSLILSDMPKTFNNNDNDKIGALIAEIEELIEKYIDKMRNLIRIQNEIENTINNIEDATDRNIIRLKYIEDYTWERICVVMNFSWNGVHKRHKKILEKIK